MKFIQLNAWYFTQGPQLLEYLKSQNPDIIHLQEVSHGPNNWGQDKSDFLKQIAASLGMQVVEGKRFEIEYDNGQILPFTNAILTKFPIIDCGYINEDFLHHKELKLSHKHEFFHTDDKNIKYLYAFEFPSALTWAVVKIGQKYLKLLTNHFTVSYNCTETIQTIDHARSVCDFVSKSKDMPTIFSGDLNIHNQSLAVKLLKEKLIEVGDEYDNSLNRKIHPIFTKQSNGLKVDYIFQKYLKVSTTKVDEEADISDHLPIIMEFEL